MNRIKNTIKCTSLILFKIIAIATLCLSPQYAYAGPEPDSEYKLLISTIVSLSFIVVHCCAVGFLAHSLGSRYWRWCILQFAAWIGSIGLFLRVLSLWSAHPDMSVLDILLTDLIFETWSLTNVLLFASVLISSSPAVALSLLHLISRNRS